MRIYLFLLLLAAAVTFLVTPAVWLLARRVGAMTAVRERDVHDAVTPRLGGLAMLAGVVAAMLIASNALPRRTLPRLPPALGDPLRRGAGVPARRGRRPLGPRLMTKLAGQVLAALLLAWQGSEPGDPPDQRNDRPCRGARR